MTRHSCLFLASLACFIVVLAVDVFSEGQFIISSLAWVATGLGFYTLTKLIADKPL